METTEVLLIINDQILPPLFHVCFKVCSHYRFYLIIIVTKLQQKIVIEFIKIL
jgi:hypothetical protein